jgi:ribosomal protein S18 acetylase RimI-like enzyme
LVIQRRFEWRGVFDNQELNLFHAQAFAHPILGIDWSGQVAAHSLGWVRARDAARLIGFVNVPWDGATHAFILDTMVSEEFRRRGIGAQLVAVAAAEARAAGCEWLHVDFEDELVPFYLHACGFKHARAGLMKL